MRRFHLLAAAAAWTATVVAQQCPGDKTGCWMCAGTPLMQCLNAASSAVDDCSDKTADERPGCLCAAYAFTADCWAVGQNCLEWRPNAVVAVEMCAFAESQSTNSSFASSASASLTSLVAVQSQVTSSIWHDDSGTDIPALAQTLSSQAYIPTATHLTDGFATAMSALAASAASGASYSGPSVVAASASAAGGGIKLATQTGSGVQVLGASSTGAPRPTGSMAAKNDGARLSLGATWLLIAAVVAVGGSMC